MAAILVESVHVDGRPRQRHIACLSSITEKDVQSIGARNRFWGEVDKRLHGLSNRLTTQERERIVSALAVKVPRPTGVEAQRSEREFPTEPCAFSRAIAT